MSTTVPIPKELRARVRDLQRSSAEHKERAEQLRIERQEIVRRLRECGVPIDQIARLIGVGHRTYVHSILRGEH